MSCNVLIVEDEMLARRNMALFLGRAKHNVQQAQSGEVALGLLSHNDFNIVISDYRLPGRINGIDVLKHQNQISPGKQLILITAFGSNQVQSEAEALGALYLEKPLSLPHLLSIIQT